MRLRVIFKSGRVEDFDDADYQIVDGTLRGVTGEHGTFILDTDEVACARTLPKKRTWRW